MPATIRVEWITVDMSSNIITKVLRVDTETLSAHTRLQPPANAVVRRGAPQLVARIVSTADNSVYFSAIKETDADVTATTGAEFLLTDAPLTFMMNPGESLAILPSDA